MLCGHNPKDERCNGQFTETTLWRRDHFMLPHSRAHRQESVRNGLWFFSHKVVQNSGKTGLKMRERFSTRHDSESSILDFFKDIPWNKT